MTQPFIETVGGASPAPSKFATQPQAEAASRRASDALLMLVLALCAALPYANTLLNGFVYDDNTQVLQNPYVRNFSHLGAIFTQTAWAYKGAQGVTNYYRPLMAFGYLLCHEIFGFRPWAYHLVNIVFHAAVVCMLFVVTRRLFHSRKIAFLAGALFALHPIHSEDVAWIAAITDLELALFFLFSFWCFLRLEDREPNQAGLLQLGMTGSFALALLAKEPAAAWPLLATFYEHTCRDDRGRTSWILKVRRYAPLWLLLIAYVLFRARILGAFVPLPERMRIPANEVFFAAVALVGQYIEKLLWPVHLCAFYPFPIDLAALLPWFAAGALALLACGYLMLYFWKRERRMCFALLWFFITLAPVLNARWMSDNVFAERYLYLPSVGFCWLAGWLGAQAWERISLRRKRWRQTLIVPACVLAALMAVRIVTRDRDWKDDLTFEKATLAASPGAADIRGNLGVDYFEHGNFKLARQTLLDALKRIPNDSAVLDDLGLLDLRQKRYQEAIVYYERSLAFTPNDAFGRAGLGEAYERLGMFRDAEIQLRQAVTLAPLDIGARVRLGQLYYDERHYALAQKEFQISVQTLPSVWGYSGLGLTHWAQGDRAGAERFFDEAIKFDPTDARPYALLGVLYAQAGRVADAIREYQQALKVEPHNEIVQAQLAALERKGAGK
jgi:protein O-mannosyl-transferase